MKKFLILCLLAAIGAVAVISRADAAPQNGLFCQSHPLAPVCQPHPGGKPPVPPPPHGNPALHRHGGWPHFGGGPMWFDQGWNNDFGPDQSGGFFGFGPHLRSTSLCADFAWNLRDQGFELVRPLKCYGKTFTYRARLHGKPVNVNVRRLSGRITSVLPAT